MPPKKIINSTIDETEEAGLTSPAQTRALSERVVFEPTSMQARLKAKFWVRFQPGPMQNIDSLTLTHVAEVTGSAQIKKWWREPGFVEWFLNRDEERERLKYLFNKSLDSLEQILDNPDANPNAKANIIKMLAEMNGYLGKKQAEKFADEEINRMSEQQLLSFLNRKGVKLVEERIVETSADDSSASDDSE